MTTTIPSGRRIGATIGLGFGGLWALLGSMSLPPRLIVAATIAALAVTAVLILRVWRIRPTLSGGTVLFRSTAYFVAVALEVAAIMAVSNLLPRYGLAGTMIPSVGVIVGLHFIGLWQAAGQRQFLGIAGGMCAVSLICDAAAAGSARSRMRIRQCAGALGRGQPDLGAWSRAFDGHGWAGYLVSAIPPLSKDFPHAKDQGRQPGCRTGR